MDYITLDPLFEYRPNDKITLIIGPSVSYLISNNLVRYVEEDGSERTIDALTEKFQEQGDRCRNNIEPHIFITEHLDIDQTLI